MNPTAITPDSNHSGVTRLQGFSIKEDAGAAATIELRKAAIGGTVVFYLNLAANESVNAVFPESISFEGGVYVKELTGSVTGVLLGEG